MAGKKMKMFKAPKDASEKPKQAGEAQYDKAVKQYDQYKGISKSQARKKYR